MSTGMGHESTRNIFRARGSRLRRIAADQQLYVVTLLHTALVCWQYRELLGM